MTKSMTATIIVALFIVLCSGKHSQNSTTPTPMSCKNAEGKTVEWFISLKMPNGHSYIHMDSNNFEDWATPAQSIESPESPLMRTLETVKVVTNEERHEKDHQRYGALFWNDQPPGTTSSKDNKAHSKGVMGFDENTGFLLIHSTPRFPSMTEGPGGMKTVDLSIIKNQTIYGQHFFCISSETEELEKIAEAYLVDDVYIYAGAIPNDLQNMFPNLYKVLTNKYIRLKDNGIHMNFFSLNKDFQFTIFGKSMAYIAPLYDKVVVPVMGSGIRTETWGNGISQLEDPNCRTEQNTVYSNLEVNVKGKYVYKSTSDHSKYGISIDPTNTYVCLGDINRQESQYRRGGGTVCFYNQKIWENFNKIMVRSQDCIPRKYEEEQNEREINSSHVKTLLEQRLKRKF